MSVIQKIRLKNSVLTCKAQSAAGSFNAPSASANAIRCENVQIGINPNVVTTNEYAASLDPNAPLVGGQKYTITVPLYLRGSGTPGTAPEWAVLAKICSLAETATKTDVTGTDFSPIDASAHTLAMTTTHLGGLTVGTVGYLSGFANAANNTEFLVARSPQFGHHHQPRRHGQDPRHRGRRRYGHHAHRHRRHRGHGRHHHHGHAGRRLTPPPASSTASCRRCLRQPGHAVHHVLQGLHRRPRRQPSPTSSARRSPPRA
jgi:hypothetical protein